MTSRTALRVLSLACALVFCAFGAADASAAGTTAFTCVPGGVEFKDAHCDQEAPGGNTGKFGHKEFAGKTEVVATNNKTGSEISSWLLRGTIAATPVEITSGGVNFNKGTMENVVGPPMKVVGTGTLEETETKLLKPVAQVNNCAVEIKAAELKIESTEMELRFSPKAGAVLTEVVITAKPGKKCPLAGVYALEGFTGATGISGAAVLPKYTGATLTFTGPMTAASLTFAGNPAEVEGSLTFRRAPIGGEAQNAIVLTTE